MSMPNIPDITPVIDISRDDALNMLLASIALEEMGLAHIINAEGEKIQSILCRDVSVPEIIEVNQTVEKLIRETMKLQMLLQEKLETVISLIPKAPPHPPGCPPSRPCCKPKCRSFCTLTGCGEGQVSNDADPFHCGTALVEVGECPKNKDGTALPLKYTLCREKERHIVSGVFLSLPESVKVHCPRRLGPCPTPQEPNVLIMQGCGIMAVERCGEAPVQCTATFTLTVWDNGCNKKFQMVICAPDASLNHDSGIVLVRAGNLEIRQVQNPIDLTCPPECNF